MSEATTYTIDGKKYQLGEIVRKCEEIAKKNKDAYFVGRETIRGRLRCGIRTWLGLTSRVASRKERIKNHTWRQGLTKSAPPRRNPDDSVYEPEDYFGPDEGLDTLLGRA